MNYGFSLRRKLVLVNVLTGLLIMLTSGTLIVVRNQELRQQLFEKRIEQQAALVAANATAAVVFEDWQGVDEILSALKTDPAMIDAIVFDNMGNQQSTVRFGPSSPQEVYSTTVPVLDANLVIGQVKLTASNHEVLGAFGETVRSVLVATALALLVGFIISDRIQILVIKPIQRLSALVKEVRENKSYQLRAEVHHNDEIGVLTADVNHMLDAIETRDQYLEHQVAERTRQLKEKNQLLENEVQIREEAHLSLRASQEKFRRAFDDAPIGMALVSETGLIHEHNARFRDLLKVNDYRLNDVIDEYHHQHIMGRMVELANSKESSFEAEVKCRSANDESLVCVMSFSAVRSESKAFLYFVLQIQDVTEARSLSDELAFLANHDSLTGLANRRAFDQALDKLESARESLQECSICFIDLDQFKVINDTCGHGAGDMLLRQIADILKRIVRRDDLLVRLGGDEFAVLLYRCNQESARVVAESIRAEIQEHVFPWEDKIFRVGASIGVVTAQRGDSNPTLLVQQADAACFAAKGQGRNRVHCVRSDDRDIRQTQGEMNWVGKLHQAMDADQFILFIQEVCPLYRTNDPPRYEILIRLKDHKNQSFIPPGAFLPAAERYGLSTKIDQWVVRNLIRTLHSYYQVLDENARYWVNLSGTSIGDPNFLSFLEIEILNAGLPPGMLNFEITETEVIQNVADAAVVMNRLKEFGCQFALDDFGSGLSSFGYLKSLPVDFIKIDGMFVRDIIEDRVDRIFVKSIIEIAKVMGIPTVAEFVESDQILETVRELGADYGQGYALGKPRPLLPSSLLTRDVLHQALESTG